MANYGWKACPASLHKRIARIRPLAFNTSHKAGTLAQVAASYAREGQCGMARATLRSVIKTVRKARR